MGRKITVNLLAVYTATTGVGIDGAFEFLKMQRATLSAQPQIACAIGCCNAATACIQINIVF